MGPVLSPTIAFAPGVRALDVWRRGEGPLRFPFAPTSLTGWFGANSRFSLPVRPLRRPAAGTPDRLLRQIVTIPWNDGWSVRHN